MIKLFQRKGKILLLALFMLVTFTACATPRGSDGKTKVDQIISSETIKVNRDEVNIKDIANKKLKAQLTKQSVIEIKPLSFGDAMKNGWFDGLIVWPIAQVINFIANATDAGMGIIIATVLIQLLVFALTGKSQMSTQRMQEIQPEIQAIQNKYKGRTDDRSKMMMYQETQAIYAKYDIHPFGTMLVTFLQLPIMMGMYYATMRASSVLLGNFMGMSLQKTPVQAFQDWDFAVLFVYALMIVLQFLSVKLPQWLKKYQDKKDHVKTHDYRQEGNSTQNTMNMTMYFMTVMFAFIYVSWPVAMSFYWAVSNIFRIIQQIVLHRVMNKKKG